MHKNENPNRQLRLESLENRRLLAGDVAAMAENAAALMGDADRNGRVDFADFLRCSDNFGSTDATWSDGDFDGDGSVGFADFTALSNNYGKSIDAGPVANASDEGDDTAGRQGRVEFRTRLSGEGSVHGEAEYELEDNGAEREFEVEVESAAPDTTYPVSVDAIVVAQITTDAAGNGRIKLSTTPDADELQLPADFPIVTETSVITVGELLSGQFNGNVADVNDSNGEDNDADDSIDDSSDDDSVSDSSDDDDNDDGIDDSSDDDSVSDSSDDDDNDDGIDDSSDDDSVSDSGDSSDNDSDSGSDDDDDDRDELELEAKLTGSGSAHGEAEFESEHGGTKLEFEVELEGAQPNATYAVAVDGIFAGNLTTDSRGRGELELSTDPGGDELPLPADFPTVGEGTNVTVGDIVGGIFALDD